MECLERIIHERNICSEKSHSNVGIMEAIISNIFFL